MTDRAELLIGVGLLVLVMTLLATNTVLKADNARLRARLTEAKEALG